jgi:hypothetical protein
MAVEEKDLVLFTNRMAVEEEDSDLVLNRMVVEEDGAYIPRTSLKTKKTEFHLSSFQLEDNKSCSAHHRKCIKVDKEQGTPVCGD